MKVEAKDIPLVQRFMQDFWKTIKDFYGVEANDDYWKELTTRYMDLYEMYPDKLTRGLAETFYKWAVETYNKEKQKDGI